MSPAPVKASPDQRHELIDAALEASGALLSVASRSLGAWDGDVTLPQFRVLVVLCTRGPQRAADLAEALGVTRPNATRMCDRLAQKKLVRRSRSSADRRSVQISATANGEDLVGQVSAARRDELARVVDQIPLSCQTGLVAAFRAFNLAAGEVPDGGWSPELAEKADGGLRTETGRSRP